MEIVMILLTFLQAAPSSTDCPAWVTPPLLGAWCQAAYSLRQILPLSQEEAIRLAYRYMQICGTT